MPNLHPPFFLRLYLTETAMLGPGKAALLEGIARTGSISAAGREMGMSYKRAWSLVEAMNAMFREPLVASARGGSGGGGASLTDTGQQVLSLYRQIEAESQAVNADRIAALHDLLTDMPKQK
ncbi:MAG: LysR family transcriptional regulator [Paracoccus sp. (in: a-proteobacteria)]|uniref:winged helix-turn-helix domain-containing protein n=1 Tax=Paracoccus sp. TaxID=267 RepID=UPI0026DF5234|nr:LysR family transcriptional regulator [Paracoccus sp. (in: a-proteobacteria)]MDO5620391.1 LysR family transcriptional regulator [Paracoccus sp. (in: a-proteobacteria)]